MNNLLPIQTVSVLNTTSKNSAIDKEIRHRKKHKKRNRSRKKSDPTITNISQLLSASLNLISPEKCADKSDKGVSSDKTADNSFNKNNLVKGNEINGSSSTQNDKMQHKNQDFIPQHTDNKLEGGSVFISDSNETPVNESGVIDLDDTLNEQKLTQSKNAFEFMMESSKKSIGRNSPGKEVEKPENTPTHQNKEKLSVRKALMEQWASAKGNKKRKIEEDKERGVYIKHRLETRAKRMKKMLVIEDSMTRQKRGRVRKLISDSEDSQDCFTNENDNNGGLVINLELEQSKVKINSNLQQKDLDKFLGISPSVIDEKQKIDGDASCDSVDVNGEQRENTIKIKMFSPQIFKRKKHIKDNVNIAEITTNNKEEKENVEKSKRHTKIKKHKSVINKNVDIPSQIDTAKSKRKSSNNGTFECIKSQNENKRDESAFTVEKQFLRRSTRATRFSNSYANFIVAHAIDSDLESEESETEEKTKLKKGKAVKLAPIFLRNKVKPKIDPLVLEARRNFLMSGIPEALKRTVEKQQSVDIIEPDFFPEISHVQQKTITDGGLDFWALPKVDIPIIDLDISLPKFENLVKGSLNKFSDSYRKETLYRPPEKIKNLKSILVEIKKNNPDYPVFRSFRLLKMKSNDCNVEETEKTKTPTKKKRGRKSKIVESEKVVKPQKNESESFTMWTEKYKANTFEDLIGNHNKTLELKRWLQGWLDVNENKSKILKHRDSSSSDFDCDSESRDSTSYPGNTIILHGPHGSGKTMTIYAICNELGIKVLELNASSKRTGKRLLQELQEATQSHQVRKTEVHDINHFFKSTSNKKHKTNESQSSKSKMCLLLVEDVDVVFEQDEGFLTALTQLISSSKRPIILVATDISSPNLQRIILQNPVIQFTSLYGKTMSAWLQILCLLEGSFVNKCSISELLEWNDGDVRKTLLELQFWVQSGGGNTMEKILENSDDTKVNIEESIFCDDNNLMLQEDTAETDSKTILMHSNCINNFTNKDHITLEKLWWNLPRFSLLPPIRQSEKSTGIEMQSKIIKDIEINKLSQCLDAISEIDKSYVEFGVIEDNNLTVKNGRFELKDSIELSERYIDFNGKDFMKEWAQSLFLGYVNGYKDMEGVTLDMGLPTLEERRWQTKQNTCKTKYMEMAPITCHTDKKSYTLDYFPSLRTITRSEMARSATNQKRRNRFFNYFRNLGFTCSDAISQTACHVLDRTVAVEHDET